MDKIVVVGHRGTGKTSLLKRWKTYEPQLKFYDLDEEIEKFAHQTVTEIFQTQGEPKFRELEKQVWANLESANVVSVGGGFNLDWIQAPWKILWVKRDSDSADRIFLDRPNLSDYSKRFQDRDQKFREKADYVYTIPEGLTHPDNEEKMILTEDFKNVGGAVTIPLKKDYPNTLIEIRDDLPIKDYKDPLYSVRIGKTFPENTKIDWDLKNPVPQNLNPYIVSSHENDVTFFKDQKSLQKFSPKIETWGELKKFYLWQRQDPENRIFLPRSEHGKWVWFRLFMKGRQKLNFWREGLGTAPDQPTLWEWLSHTEKVENFAAVLGAPVKHSYSPVYHKTFFKPTPFYRIHIEEKEWDEAFEFLEELGLIAAAVTSPLKHQAGKFVNQSALNTLKKQNGKWMGTNTDIAGAEALLSDFKNKSVAVWGGGGVLETLQSVLPNASFYSSQKAQPREGYKEINPEIVVWADPYPSLENIPKSWSPKTIVDLSYHDKSPARLYAIREKAQYVSGLKMFDAQAIEQQKFWKN